MGLEDEQVSAELTDGDGNAVDTVVGALRRLAIEMLENRPSTSTVTSIALSTSVVTLLAANTSRRSAIIVNDSEEMLYLKLGTGASATSYTVQLDEEDVYEIPFPAYTGIITGIWGQSGTGSARVTEIP